MSENSMAAAVYNDMAARPDFYNEQWGFNPLNYLRQTSDEEGRAELSLDVKFRKHWFRLVYPAGKITAQPVDVNDLGARILGSSHKVDEDKILKLLSQNPLGQSRESTPMGILRPIYE